VPWERVRQDIINLNFQLKNHLLVSMAVCEGTWLLSIMRATHTSPFNCLVSSQGLISMSDIKRGFPAFYDSLFPGDSLVEATHELNLAQNGSHFILTTTEEVFTNVFRKYFSELCSPLAMEARSDNISRQLSELGVTDEELNRKLVQLYRDYVINGQEQMFEKYREAFFMHDAYPENMAEFCPTYAQLKTGASAPTRAGTK